MADKIVEVPGMGTVAFPDSMSDDQISQAIQKQTPPADAHPEAKSVSGFVGNTMQSTGKLAEDMFSAVRHPLDTGNAIMHLTLGTIEHGLNALGPIKTDQDYDLVSHVAHQFVDRYGSPQKFADTFYQDPMGVLSDAATFVGGAAGVVSKLGDAADLAKASRVASAARTASTALRTTADATNPLTYAGKGAGVLLDQAKDAAQTGSQYLYRTALKPRANTPIPQVADMVQTGLQNRIPVSQEGLADLTQKIDDVNQAIAAKINAGGQQGQTVSRADVASRLKPVEQRFAMQVAPEQDLRDISKVGDQFTRTNPTDIPVAEAQSKKIGTYQQIQGQYGKLSNAAIEAQKALALGLKEELVRAIPELGALNAKDSSLINLQNALEKRVTSVTNRGTSGFGGTVAGGAVGAASGNLSSAIAVKVLKDVVSDPAVRSQLAIALNRASGMSTPKATLADKATALARIKAYTDSLGQ